MVPVVFVLILVAFLLGAGTAIFLMIVVSIHKADRSKSLADAPCTYADAATRRMLGASGCARRGRCERQG
jgi:hypothetical protein